MKRHKNQFPVKTTVNLLYRERSSSAVVRMVLVAVVLAIGLAVFTKFAIIDRLVGAARALQEAADREMEVLELQQKNMDYEDVLREYQHYYFSITDSEGGGQNQVYVDCQEVLDLLDDELLNKAGIQSVKLSGNVLTVNLTRINLERASDIARSLSENEMVDDVMVSAANRHDAAEGTAVYLTVVLKTGTDNGTEGDK